MTWKVFRSLTKPIGNQGTSMRTDFTLIFFLLLKETNTSFAKRLVSYTDNVSLVPDLRSHTQGIQPADNRRPYCFVINPLTYYYYKLFLLFILLNARYGTCIAFCTRREHLWTHNKLIYFIRLSTYLFLPLV